MKYIIEIKPEYKDSFKGLIILGAKDSDYFVDTLMVDDLEVLNSDYINEHFSDLQDTAYQRGLEDGKAVSDKGCVGCKWEGNGKDHSPCDYCCNCYSSQWAAKQTDDEIKVGDTVNLKDGSRDNDGIVTKSWDNDRHFIMWADGSGGVWDKEYIVKTGRHFDISSILKEMQND